jgi:glycosyltransferase involved in cell wall biosynthesis
MAFFSIVIPTYNRAHLLGKTLESVVRQDFSDFEVIVVDDGSTDNTEEVVTAFSERQVRYFKKLNGERGAARNFGRSKSTGTYVNFFDSDDLMYENHLTVARQFIESNNYPEIFHLAYDFKDATGRVTKKVDSLQGRIEPGALLDNFLSCNGVFVRREIAEQFPFDENRVLASAEDWELWIRLMARFEMKYSNSITSSVVNHDARSIRTIATQKIIARDTYLIKKIQSDSQVMKAFGKMINKFIASRFTFFMLCLAEDGNKAEVWQWAKRAVAVFPPIAFTARFLASIKKTVI